MRMVAVYESWVSTILWLKGIKRTDAASLAELVKEYDYHGFPVTASDRELVGYVTRAKLKAAIGDSSLLSGVYQKADCHQRSFIVRRQYGRDCCICQERGKLVYH